MAISNAERQRRFRQRQKEALRNASGGETLPRLLYERYSQDGFIDDDYTPEGLVAEAMLPMLRTSELRHDLGDDDEIKGLTEMLGGSDYIRALHKWEEDMAVFARKRKNAGDPPQPPGIPGVT